MTVKVSIPQSKYTTTRRSSRQFFNRLFERLDALPGVRPPAATSFLPLTGLGSATGFEIVGKPKPARGQEPVTDVRVITHNYFKAMGVPLVRGRAFDARDTGRRADRVIINQTLREQVFPRRGSDRQEHRRQLERRAPDEIVGVVGDVRQQDSRPRRARPSTGRRRAFTYPFMTIAIRTAGDPRGVVPAVAALHEMDPNVAAADVRTMEEIVDISVAQRRLTMLLLSIFAALALVLAAVGIYGVIG